MGSKPGNFTQCSGPVRWTPRALQGEPQGYYRGMKAVCHPRDCFIMVGSYRIATGTG